MSAVALPSAVTVRLRNFNRPGKEHPQAHAFVECDAKRQIARAGRRGAKTVTLATKAVIAFLEGRRVLYTAPTTEQTSTFWKEVKRALAEPLEAKVFYKNETEQVIELRNTDQRIRAKTAWNADTLRGDYGDLLIFDEWQLMNEDAWEVVGAPMLLDNDGTAVFVYTPPSIRSRSVSKASDPRHAPRMFARVQTMIARGDTRWAAFHWTSHDNPFISESGLEEITLDMSRLAFRQEILAEDVEDVPGALWTQKLIDDTRVVTTPKLIRIVVAIDPPGTSRVGGAEAGIVASGLGEDAHYYVLKDASRHARPEQWAKAALDVYDLLEADAIIGESNFGGEMVESVVRAARKEVKFSLVSASRGKQVRAEPVSALSERKMLHLAGVFTELEEQMTGWVPGDPSPDRMDAMVWGVTELMQRPSKNRAGATVWS